MVGRTVASRALALALAFAVGAVAGGVATVGIAAKAFQASVWARIAEGSRPAFDRAKLLRLAERLAAKRFNLDRAQRAELSEIFSELARDYPAVRDDSAAKLRSFALEAYERMAPSLDESQRAEAERVLR